MLVSLQKKSLFVSLKLVSSSESNSLLLSSQVKDIAINETTSFGKLQIGSMKVVKSSQMFYFWMELTNFIAPFWNSLNVKAQLTNQIPSSQVESNLNWKILWFSKGILFFILCFTKRKNFIKWHFNWNMFLLSFSKER